MRPELEPELRPLVMTPELEPELNKGDRPTA